MKKIGVLGGGQLGMMLQEAAISSGLDVELHFLDPDKHCSCSKVSAYVKQGSFKSKKDVLDFGRDKDIITVEIEHVDIEALIELQDSGVKVYPQPDVLALIQDKGAQKEFYRANGLPTARFELLDSPELALERGWPLPFVLKSRKGGYDGKGVQIVREESELQGIGFGVCVLEEMVPLVNELSIIVARNVSGEIKWFPLVEMEFDSQANLVHVVRSPAQVSERVREEAEKIARSLIAELDMVGVLAIELFLLEDESLMINEIAPRPHNSGHITIEGNRTSQYEQHLRAILDEQLGDTEAIGQSVMVNLLGSKGHEGPTRIQGEELLSESRGEFLHDYRKEITRPMRKMGHFTIRGTNRNEVYMRAMELDDKLKYIS